MGNNNGMGRLTGAPMLPPTGPDARPLYVDAKRGGARGAVSRPGGLEPFGSGPPLPPPAPAQLIGFPKDYFPPDGATDFNPSGFQANQTVAMGAVVVASYQLPPNDAGVIRSIVLGAGNWDAAAAGTWAILVNGAAAPGWGSLTIFPQPAAFVSVGYGPDETRVQLPAGALVQLVTSLTAGGPYNMAFTVHGWHWSAQG